jgi:hypothetical protein
VNDSDLCVCGHAFDQHNDITKRCCFRVTVGLDRGESDTDPITRICDLCPPSGFTTGFDAGIFGLTWPREHWLADGDREYTRLAMNLQESKIVELTAQLAAAETRAKQQHDYAALAEERLIQIAALSGKVTP